MDTSLSGVTDDLLVAISESLDKTVIDPGEEPKWPQEILALSSVSYLVVSAIHNAGYEIIKSEKECLATT